MATTGKVGAIYASDGTDPIPFVDEPTTGDLDHKRYQVTDPAYRYWPLDGDIEVEVDGVPVTTGFTLERAGGCVVFDESQGESEITVSGTAMAITQAGGFFSWSVDTDADDLDATTFESDGRKEFVRGLTGWSGAADAYWGDQRFFNSLGEIVVVKLFVDAGASQRCLEGFALINGAGIEGAVDALVEQSIEWTGVGPLYLRL